MGSGNWEKSRSIRGNVLRSQVPLALTSLRCVPGFRFDIDLRETGAESPSSADLAASAKREGYPLVIVAGGDGTVAPAAIELLDSEVTLGILPFGSWMNIANGLGIPLRPIDAARVIAERRTKRCDVGEVGEKTFFETCGIGLDADAFGAARSLERQRWRSAIRRIIRWATRSPRDAPRCRGGEGACSSRRGTGCA